MAVLGLEMFQNTRKGNKCNDMVVTTPVAYATGFGPLDYANGQEVLVYDDNEEIQEIYDSIGFVEGTMITILADSGLGKTTSIQQFSTNICAQFPMSFVVHEDIEAAGMANRVFNIAKVSVKWLRTHYAIYQDSHAENVRDRLIDHAKTKLNNRKAFEYDTGLKDLYGEKLIKLQPSCVILDSLAVMRSEETNIMADADKVTGNMSGARNAKFNNEIFKQILPFLKKANIILFVVNHINRKVETGFVKSARDLIGLGENEAVAGGRSAIYLANNVLRYKNKATLKPDKEYGILGHVISAQFYKSRTNASQRDLELIFDKSEGFSVLLTHLHFCIQNELVEGKGNMNFPGSDIKFKKKTFKEQCRKHPELITMMYDVCLPELRKLLSKNAIANNQETDEEAKAKFVEIMNQL